MRKSKSIDIVVDVFRFLLNIPKIKKRIVSLDKKAFSRITLYLIIFIFFFIYQFYFSNLVNVVFAATTWNFVSPTPVNNTCTTQAPINATVIDGTPSSCILYASQNPGSGWTTYPMSLTLGSPNYCYNGTWWQNVGDGRWYYKVNMTDTNGFSSFSNGDYDRTFVLDRANPSVTANPTTYPSEQTRAKNGDNVTFNVTVTDSTISPCGVKNVSVNLGLGFNCTQAQGSLLSLTKQGTTDYWIGNCTVNATNEGTYYLTVSAYDNVNHLNNTVQVVVSVDYTPPSITITSPENNKQYNTSNVNLTFTPVDNYASSMTCWRTLDGVTTLIGTVNNNVENKTVMNLEPGIHQVNVTCRDNAYNNGTSSTITFEVWRYIYANVTRTPEAPANVSRVPGCDIPTTIAWNVTNITDEYGNPIPGVLLNVTWRGNTIWSGEPSGTEITGAPLWGTPHCYVNSQTYTSSYFSCPPGTTKFQVYHYIATEANYDYYYIYSGGQTVYTTSGCVTGGTCGSDICSAPNGAWSSNFTYYGPIQFKLTTDGSVVYYGIKVEKIRCWGGSQNGTFDIPNDSVLGANDDFLNITITKPYYFTYTNNSSDYNVQGVLNQSGSLISWTPSGNTIDNFEPSIDGGPLVTTSYLIRDDLSSTLTEGTHYIKTNYGDWNASDNNASETITSNATFTGINNYCGIVTFSKNYTVHGKIESISSITWSPSGDNIDRFSGGSYGGPDVSYSSLVVIDNKGNVVPSTNYSENKIGDWNASDNNPGDVITAILNVTSKLDAGQCTGLSCYWHSYVNQSKNYTVWANLTIKSVAPANNTIVYRSTCNSPSNVTLRVNLTDDKGNLVPGANTIIYYPSGTCSVVDENNGYYNCTYDPSNTITPGLYTWTAEASKSYYHNTGNATPLYLEIRGCSNINITQPSNTSSFNRSQIMNIRINITDEFNQPVSSANVVCEITKSNSEKVYPTCVYNSSSYLWEGNYTFSNNDPVGIWYLKVNVSGTYSYAEKTHEISLFGKLNVTSVLAKENVDRGLDWGYGTIALLNATVQDESGLLTDVNVKFYANNSLIGENTTDNGVARLYWDPSNDLAVGQYKIDVEAYKPYYYNDTSRNLNNYTNVYGKLFVRNVSSQKNVDRKNDYGYGTNALIEVNVSDDLYVPINLSSVEFYVDTIGLIGTNTTGVNGTYRYNWNPADNINPNLYVVYANARNVLFYHNYTDTMPNDTITVWGKLNITSFGISDRDIYRVGESTVLSANVSDENTIVLNNATVYFIRDSTIINTTNTTNGYASYTYDPSNTITPNNYTMYANTSKQYYHNDSKQDWLIIRGKINLAIISPTSNQKFYRNDTAILDSNVSDENGLVVSPDWAEWKKIFPTSEVISNQADYNWIIPYNYAKGLISIQFNATKNYYDVVSIIPSVDINIWSKANVTILNSSQNLNRGNNITIVAKVSDHFTGENLANYNISWFVNNLNVANYTTTADGTSSYYWITNCSYGVGVNQINATIKNDTSNYIDANVANSKIDIFLIGNFSTSIISPPLDTIYHVNDVVWLNSSTINDCGAYITPSVTWRNETDVIQTGVNTTWTIPLDYNRGVTNITVYANESYYYNATNSTRIIIYRWVNLTNLNPINVSYPAGSIINISCVVRDANSSLGIVDYPVNFYKNNVFQNTSYSNSSGFAIWKWNTTNESTGNYTIKCNITDNSTLYLNKSYPYEQQGNISIERRLWITNISVDNTTIYRNDSWAILNNYAYASNITIEVWDAAISPASNAIVHFFNLTNEIANCTTNTNGVCSILFNPSDTIIIQNYTIFINATKIGNDPSPTENTTIQILGLLKINTSNYPLILDINYENETIEATIQHDIQLTNVIVNITLPNTTIISSSMQSIGNDNYIFNYTPRINGTHSFFVYAIDVSNFLNQTTLNYFYAYRNTTLSLSQLPQSIQITNITYLNSQQFQINLNVSNLGNSGAYYTNISVEAPSGWNLAYDGNCGLIKTNSCLKSVLVTVPANTIPNIYYVNATVTWMNPDNTYNSVVNTTSVNVTSNPLLNISQNIINLVVKHNTTNTTFFTVQSIGNDNLSNIQFSCYSGIACDNFTISFSPSSISLLEKGSSQNVNVNVSVPLGYVPGNYTGFIRANATNSICNPSSNCWDNVTINVEVPATSTWYAEEMNFSLPRVNTSSSGFIGNVTINNTGNVPIQFTWQSYGNISYMLLGEDITVENQSAKNFTISYSIPYSLNDTNTTPAFYSGGIKIIAVNGIPQSMNFSVNFSVYDIFAPKINNFNLSSNFLDINYGVLNVSANVTDNVKIQSVYAEFSRTGKKFSVLMTNTYDNIYEYSCKADGSCIDALGIWSIRTIAYDTANNPENPPPGYNVNSSSYLQVEVVGKTNVEVLSIPVINVSNITQGYSYEFNITPIFNNTYKGTAFYSNLSINITPPLTIDNSSSKTTELGNVSRYSSVNRTYLVKIPAATPPGTYLINYNGSWMNADNSYNSTLNETTINIASNPLLKIVEGEITTTIAHGSSNTTSFNISSYGNDNLTNIEITCASGFVCTDPCFTVSFDKNNLNLSAGNSSIIIVNVNVGLGCNPGNYTGVIKANATNSVCSPSSNCWDNVTINVNVLTSPTWGITPTYYSKIVYDNSNGNVTDILINNTGNVQINLSITLSGNATTPMQLINVSQANVSVDKISTKNITISYSIPNNQVPGIYQAIISFTNTSQANPTQLNATILIDVRDPYLPTISNTSLSKNLLEANFDSLSINATVTDNVGVSKVWANITLPNQTINVIFMDAVGGNLYTKTYVPKIGGIHNVTIYANDTSNNIASLYVGSFNVIGNTTGYVNQIPLTNSFNNITYFQGAQYNISFNLTNNGNATMRYLNLTIQVPSSEYDCVNGKCKWNFTCSGPSCNGTSISCGDLPVNEKCNATFTIFVPKGTIATSENIFGIGRWLNPDLSIGSVSNYTTTTVISNPYMNVTPPSISNSVEQGTTNIIGSINISAHGNSPLYSLNYTVLSGNLSNSWLSFLPQIADILVGQTKTLYVYTTVPGGQLPGFYNNTLVLNATGSSLSCDPNSSYYNPNSKCWEYVSLNLIVPENWSWNRYPSSTYILVPITTGGYINITINNTGNMNLGFNVQYSGDTAILDPYRPTSVNITKQSSTILQVGYNSNYTGSGIYNVVIKLVNLSIPDPYPKEQNTSVTLNVTNVPPNIQNASVTPGILDIKYQSVNISAIVTHPFALSSIWANITKPDSSNVTIAMQKGIGDDYHATYTPMQEGVYSVVIYANESRDGLINSSSVLYFIAFATTSIELTSIPNQTTIYGITQENGNTTNLNVTIKNTGMATGYNTQLSIQAPSNWITTPQNINYGNFTRGSTSSNTVTVTIPKATLPGIYYVNLTLSWMNPNDVVSSITLPVKFEVSANPVVNFINKQLISTTLDGYSNYTILTINSTGNIGATEITITCSFGECSNLSTTTIPSFISYLGIGNTRDINVSFFVPIGYPAGSHLISINATTSGKSDFANITINVPPNYTWNRTPSSISARVGVSENYTTTEIGRIEINNLGNIEMLFNITIDNSTYIYPNVTTISIPRQSKGIIGVRTIVPSERGVHNATITIKNNLTQEEMNTTVNLEVTELRVNVISPTSNEQRPVKWNDTLEVYANVTFQGVPVTSEVNWTIELSNSVYGILERCTLNSSSYLTDRWKIICIIPKIKDAISYDLIASAYAYNSSINTTSSATRTNALFYEDITPPKFISVNVTHVQPNETALIKVDAIDNVEVLRVWANITLPDSTKRTENFTFVQNLWQLSFNDTSQIGDYELEIYALDNSSNINQTSDWFGSYYPMRFYGEAKDIDGNPYYVEFDMYRPSKINLLFNVTSNQTGSYDKNISARVYDIEINAFKNKIKLYNVNLTKFNNSGIFNPLILDDISAGYIGYGALKGIYIDIINSIYYTSGTLTIDFSGIPIHSINWIGIYKCDSFDRYTRKCNAVGNITNPWYRIGGIVSGYTTSLNLSSFSAYAAAEYICGNGVCESGTGESSANCPIDCPTEIPAPPGGAPGAPTPTIPTVNLTNITEALVNISEKIEELMPPPAMSVITKSIYVELHPGEYKMESIDITNNLNRNITVNISVEGAAWEFVQFEKTQFEIPPKKVETVNIKLYALPTALPGIYPGKLIVKTENITSIIPITVKVELAREALLDVKIETITKVIKPDEPLQYRVSLYNMGTTKKIDVTINYTIRSIELNRTILSQQETLAIETSLSFRRSIKLPNDTKPGKFIIEAVAYYDNRTASSIDTFDIAVTPFVVNIFWRIFTSPITYVLIGIVVAIYYGRKYYLMWIAKKKAAARYIFPVSFNKLPKAGKRSIPVGKIAETEYPAYFDIDNLTMHVVDAGGTGSGKSVSAMIIAEELLKKGIPVIVFDPTLQWTGFIKACRDKKMLELYPKFGLKPSDARAFPTNIIVVTDPEMEIDIKKLAAQKGEITVFCLSKLTPEQLDKFVRKTIDAIFAVDWSESKELRLLVVYDEVHRLLPKYGGKGGYVALERGCREFRKWGIGLFMISQVLMDFRGAIRANIGTEIQLRTKYEGDIGRVKQKYGMEYSATLPKLRIGTGMVQNPDYNDGKPYFIQFRPLLHDTFRITNEELKTYEKFQDSINEIERKIKDLKSKGVDTYDIEVELGLAREKLKHGLIHMVETYIDSMNEKIKGLEK